MSKEKENIPNNIKSFLNNNLTPVQIETFLKKLSDDYDVSERSLQEDMRGLPVPYWRQQVWSKELSSYKSITKEELFPDQTERDVKVKEKKTEKVK